MEALTAAEEAAKAPHSSIEKPRQVSEGEGQSIDKVRQYIRQSLNRELPDIWEKLAEVAPEVLDGYMRFRKSIIKPDLSGALPKKMLELAIVGWDILDGNS